MDIKVRGCDTKLTVEGDTIVLRIKGTDAKDEVAALKKLKEWAFVKEPKKDSLGHVTMREERAPVSIIT